MAICKVRIKDRVEPRLNWLVVHTKEWLRNTFLLLLAVEILPLSVTLAKHSLSWLTYVNCIVLAWIKENQVNYDSLWYENSSQLPATLCKGPLFLCITFFPLSQIEWTSSEQQPSPLLVLLPNRVFSFWVNFCNINLSLSNRSFVLAILKAILSWLHIPFSWTLSISLPVFSTKLHQRI